jgi:hypothetical protein
MAQSYEGLLYTNNGTTITITGYTGTNGLLTIPSAIDGLPVTSIGDSAFADSSLQSLALPESLLSIGDRAFSGCLLLRGLTLPAGMTNIGAAAFEGCQSLPSLILPAGITAISDDAFHGCKLLPSLTIPGTVATVGNNAFESCLGLTNLTLGSGVASLGVWAFAGCQNLTHLTIPASVTNIGPLAFSQAFGDLWFPSSTTLTLANGITDIGNAAFCGCGATTMVIPASVTNIEADAFSFCWMRSIFFGGTPPVADPSAFFGASPTILYLPGTPGWGTTFDGCPTLPWQLPYPVILNQNSRFVGAQSNGFQFTISWAAHSNVVIEATTSLSNPAWQPVATTALTNGAGQFTDPLWTNYPARFYRVRSP